MIIEPAIPFSNGSSYEWFCEQFCYRCKKGKWNDKTGFPEYVEYGGCPIWDAMECARFDADLFPKEAVKIMNDEGETVVWEACSKFETDDEDIMRRYRKLFGGEE